MKRKDIAVITALGIITLFGSCAKEGPNGPTGPAGPSYIGTISGHVTLFDQYGSRVTTGLSNVSLSLNGNTTIVHPDNSGFYSYPSISTGIYTLAASDSAYASTINSFNYVSGTLNKDMKMSAIPDSFVYSLTTSCDTITALDSLVLTFKHDTRARNCIVFASTSPAVGNTPDSYLWFKVISVSATAPAVSFVVPRQDLTDVGMVSGARVYYVAYSYVVGDASAYEDFNTGKNVYNAVNGAVRDSTLVP
jgi:hypothetical protein